MIPLKGSVSAVRFIDGAEVHNTNAVDDVLGAGRTLKRLDKLATKQFGL